MKTVPKVSGDNARLNVIRQEGGTGGRRVLGVIYKDGDVWRIEGDGPDGPTFANDSDAFTEVAMREC